MITLKINSEINTFISSKDCYNFLKEKIKKNELDIFFKSYNSLILVKKSYNMEHHYLLSNIFEPYKKISNKKNDDFICYGINILPSECIILNGKKEIINRRIMDYYVYIPFQDGIIYEFIPYDARNRLYYNLMKDIYRQERFNILKNII